MGSVIQKQQQALAKRRMPLGQMGRRMKKRIIGGGGADAPRPVTVEGKWELCLTSLGPDYFSSPEAALGGEGKGGKGAVLCEGLGVNEESCKDAMRAYNLVYRVKHTLGQPAGSCEGFRSAIGQHCGAFVSLRKKSSDFAHDMRNEGAVFIMFAGIKVVEAFINYFIKQARASTVRSKATHLKKMGGFAHQHFAAAGKPEEASQVAAVCEHLRNVSCAQKFQARSEHRSRKPEEERLGRSEFLLPADFTHCAKAAKDCLDGIMKSCAAKARDSGRGRARR